MTTYTNPFTGQTINPSEVGYSFIALSVNSTLEWPINGTDPTSGYVAAGIIEVNPSTGSLTLAMPSALQVSSGQSMIVRNVGSNAFTMVDAGGNTIASIASGVAQFIYLTNNNSNNGLWGSVQYGAGTSSANAATLAGKGLIADGSQLKVAYNVTTVSSTPYAVPATGLLDGRAQFYVWTIGVGVFNLPSAGTVGNNWFFVIRNSGTGIVTVTPSGGDLIDGNSTLQLQLGNSCVICSNGTGWNTFGIGQSTQYNYTNLALNVTGGTLNLTTAQAANVIQTYTSGTGLISNQIIVLPSTVQTYFVSNKIASPNGFALTFQTAGGGTSFSVPASQNAILTCDGLNVNNASNITALGSVLQLTLGAGSAGSPALNFSSAATSGVYSPSSTTVALSANGVQALLASSTVVTIPVGLAGGAF
jgi:hypothetical protein